MAADTSTSAQKRRVAKPLIEKRRRARINYSLAQLKEMVAKPNSKIQENRSNRLEKADILEMTVEYVKRVHGTSNNTTVNPDSDRSFEEGYRLCMSEVQKFFIGNYRKQPSKEFLSRSLQSYLKQKFRTTPVFEEKIITATTFEIPISSKIEKTLPKEHIRKYDEIINHEKNFPLNNDNYEFHSETSNFESNSSSASTDDEMPERLPAVEEKLKELKEEPHFSNSILQRYPTQNYSNINLNISESMWRPW